MSFGETCDVAGAGNGCTVWLSKGTCLHHSTNVNTAGCFSVVCQCQLPRRRIHPTFKLRSGPGSVLDAIGV
jgi:hypothetical protein